MAHLSAPVKGEENFSPFAQKRWSNYSGLALLSSQKSWFSVAILGSPVRVMESESYFSGLALLPSQKCWFSVALLGASVRGM